MAIADSSGFPLASHIESASPHEVSLLETTLYSAFTEELPEILIGDKTYDSDELDKKLEDEHGAKFIAPNKVN